MNTKKQTQICRKCFVRKLRTKMVNEEPLAETVTKYTVENYDKIRADFKDRRKK